MYSKQYLSHSEAIVIEEIKFPTVQRCYNKYGVKYKVIPNKNMENYHKNKKKYNW